MSDLPTDEARRLAEETVRGWTPERAAMAMRAAGLQATGKRKESLDAIAQDYGVSRESVRRARIELVKAVEVASAVRSGLTYERSMSLTQPSSDPGKATARALRRLLTMTGPLPWDEVLNAWARAQGRHPYLPLPTDTAQVGQWLLSAEGLVVNRSNAYEGALTVGVKSPEKLDRVSAFLLECLQGRSRGVQRTDLFDAAERVSLKSTTIATALSHHPAVVRLDSGMWALRGLKADGILTPTPEPKPKNRRRPRPTRFHWAATGALVLEFSVPHGPSPVVAVPRAIADLVEGRSFTLEGGSKTGQVTVRQARLWGFAPLVGELGITHGQRVELSLDLLDGVANLEPLTRQEGSDDGIHA